MSKVVVSKIKYRFKLFCIDIKLHIKLMGTKRSNFEIRLQDVEELLTY